jgi:hypothetical protein
LPDIKEVAGGWFVFGTSFFRALEIAQPFF